MDRIAYLEDQIARAERLEQNILDTLAVERLQAYAADCRRRVAALRRLRQEAA
jgi:hypothetical protein